jgi:tRNA pseudouridine55 synthase
VPERLHLPTGELMQRPPAYSAVKVGGERLYEKARRGEPVEGSARPVFVYRFEELWREGERVGLEIECSSGTYVRQLVADLDDAYCEELERTAIGPFALSDADPGRLVPLNEALSFLPEQQISEEEARRVSHGMTVDCRLSTVDSEVRLASGNRLLAIAEPRDGQLQPRIVFPS